MGYKILFQVSLLMGLLVVNCVVNRLVPKNERNFYIDVNNNMFVRDDEPFQYVSGSIHPYRVPNELWEDRLMKMWSGGLNAIQMYILILNYENY